MRAPEFWAHDGTAGRALAPLGTAYDLAGRLRRILARPTTSPVPVVCIGNLVAGGAGKTPVALAVAARLQARGLAVHFLTRGYGGHTAGPLAVDRTRHRVADVGDEALLLARQAPTWVARDRAAGARAAAAAGAEVIVMDDGFQNPGLAKDLSLLVIDGAYGLGNGQVMPAGPLREKPARALARAQGIVLLGEDHASVAERFEGRLPVLHASLESPPEAAKRLAGRRVFAFAGIGRPDKFFETLRHLDAELVETRSFPDHHAYNEQEIEALLARAKALDALPVTTEKDHLRLAESLASRVETLPVAVAWRDLAPLDALLERLESSRQGPHG